MAIPSYRRGEKRRSSRVTLAVPIRVDGENIARDKFIVSTTTQVLSQYGCLIHLEEDVIIDQTLVLMNEHTQAIGAGPNCFYTAPPQRSQICGSGIYFAGGEFLAADVCEARGEVVEEDLRGVGRVKIQARKNQRITVVARNAWARWSPQASLISSAIA